jgi:hypothetical protein
MRTASMIGTANVTQAYAAADDLSEATAELVAPASKNTTAAAVTTGGKRRCRNRPKRRAIAASTSRDSTLRTAQIGRGALDHAES